MSEKAIPVSQELCGNLFSSKFWFRMPIDFFRILKGRRAMVLAILCNHSDWADAPENHDGWFHISTTAIGRDIKTTPKKVVPILKYLSKQGFISIFQFKRPSRNFYKIHFDEIITAINAAQRLPKRRKARLPDKDELIALLNTNLAPKTGSPQNGVAPKTDPLGSPPNGPPSVVPQTDPTHIREEKTGEKKQKRTPANAGKSRSATLFGQSDTPTEADVHHAAAQQLWIAVKTIGPKFRNPNIEAWASELRSLAKEVPDYLDMLEWYCANISEDRMPEAYCGASFAKKYNQVVAARLRMERYSKTPDRKSGDKDRSAPPNPSTSTKQADPAPKPRNPNHDPEVLALFRSDVGEADRLYDHAVRARSFLVTLASALAAPIPERPDLDAARSHLLAHERWVHDPSTFVSTWINCKIRGNRPEIEEPSWTSEWFRKRGGESLRHPFPRDTFDRLLDYLHQGT